MSQSAQGQAAAKKPDAAEPTSAMHAQPQAEHHWLQKLVGDWTYEADADAKPGEPSARATGAERGRSIGGLWVQLEGSGQMPGGGAATTIMTLGFDPAKSRFVGSWIGSMMTHQWTYDGELDAAREALVLTSEGPSMSDSSKMALYRDTIEFQGNDSRTLTASVQDEHGAWRPFMTVRYKRA